MKWRGYFEIKSVAQLDCFNLKLQLPSILKNYLGFEIWTTLADILSKNDDWVRNSDASGVHLKEPTVRGYICLFKKVC